MSETLEKYLPLVHRVVNRVAKGMPAHVPREDLISFGTLGLISAMERFQPEKGVKFETFATWRIRGAVLDGIREMDWVPRQVRQWAKEIERAYAAVETHKAESASDQEVADWLGISVQEFHRRMAQVSLGSVASLEEAFHPAGDDAGYHDLLPDPTAEDPSVRLTREELREVLEQAINRLPEKEKLVIALYYYEELSIKEIAEILEVTSARISQLHSKAICRLRGALSRRRQDLKL
ncbi:FliA/WhiG family RNA polymerase sigma factor [Effusibacillus pohliae]|uniref:FliA/WhiG family RNA polymerase sigma factor n=1 Tax=Effusibacillus pohliae TaxID=232270 RepID=UPI0003732C65|nr:FliA/WhiG family RNA polymerase sigma factor [Effusibacillus pohliae]